MRHVFAVFALITLLCTTAAAQRPAPPRLVITPTNSSYDAEDFDSTAVGVTVRSNTPTETGLFRAEANWFHRQTIDNDSVIPEDLYDIGLSLMYLGRDNIAILSVSSPSDEPFNSSDEIKGFGALATNVWRSGNHSAMAGVAASNSKIFGFTYFFPYISYAYRSPTLRVSFPAPAEVVWNFAEHFRYTIYYHFNGDAFTSIAWLPTSSTTIAVEAARTAEEYLIADRPDTEDHLFIRATTAGLRVTQTISPTLVLNAFGGYSFDGSYFVSDSVNDPQNEVEFEDSPVVSVGVEVRF